MLIGVAIPCYRRHLYLLKRLLDSLEFQVRKPDAVAVSCSSCTEEDQSIITPLDYSFPVQIQYHRDKKNAAENRNIAASLLDTDWISFFDADDCMHPQRLQAIMSTVESFPVEFVLHSYISAPTFEPYPELDIAESSLCLNIEAGGVMCSNYPIHHAHVSVSKSCWKLIKFDESPQYARLEDSIYCMHILTQYPTQNSFITNPLSSYIGEGETYNDTTIV